MCAARSNVVFGPTLAQRLRPPSCSFVDVKDFERAWPRNWGKVKLEDYLL